MYFRGIVFGFSHYLVGSMIMGSLLPITIWGGILLDVNLKYTVLFASALFSFHFSDLVSPYLKVELPLHNILGVLSQIARVMKWS